MTKTLFSKINLAISKLALVLIAFSFLNSVVVSAQTTTNSINLQFPKVTVNGKTDTTDQATTNAWEYNKGDLAKGDEIRYSWRGVDLNTRYKNIAATGGGYLKVYLNDDSKNTNLIKEIGSSPLKISDIASRLTIGKNKLLFVYINSARPSSVDTKVSFSFNFKDDSRQPGISILSPVENSIFTNGVERDFRLRLTNFKLSDTSTEQNTGKIRVYHTSISDQNILGTLSSSTQSGGEEIVDFNSKDLNFNRIPDSKNSKLIFVLVNKDGGLLGVNKELIIQTNYNGNVDLGLPEIVFISHSSGSEIQVSGDTSFVFEVRNFEVLKLLEDSNNESGKGIVQIDLSGVPLAASTEFEGNSFTLNGVGAQIENLDSAELKIRLLNKDLTELNPKAEDSINITFVQDEEIEDSNLNVETNNWRGVIVILTVVLVVGGISILITKG